MYATLSMVEYAGILIGSVNFHMDLDLENHSWGFNPVSLTAGAWRELQTLAGLIGFGVLLWWARRAHKNEPAIFALLLCAGVSYLPVCGLFSLNANIAEHWIYVPLAFILLAVSLQVALIVRSRAVF